MLAPRLDGIPQWAEAASAPTGLPALLAANLRFALRLQSQLLRQSGSRNVFFSPFSASLALAMLYNGASGHTRRAMSEAFTSGALTTADINSGNLQLLNELHSRDAAITLNVSDAIWLRQGFAVVPAFAAALQGYYSAVPRSANFADPRTPGAINAWVSRQTHGLISSIVGPLDPATVLLLINALYFKGAWSAPFSPEATRPASFTTGGGQKKTVPMMAQTGSFAYAHGVGTEVIRLPYGNGRLSMIVVLPPNGGLRSWVAGLTPATWTAVLASLAPAHGSLRLPRFSVNYGTSLKPALSALGMGEAFQSRSAQFPGILAGQHAFVGDIRHRAVLKVNEHGTLAAAVTTISVGVTAIPGRSFNIVVNRPFFCAIRDDITASLLFCGAIKDPASF